MKFAYRNLLLDSLKLSRLNYVFVIKFFPPNFVYVFTNNVGFLCNDMLFIDVFLTGDILSEFNVEIFGRNDNLDFNSFFS